MSGGKQWLASWLDSSIAGAMTAVSGVLFLLAFLFSPRHGVVAKAIAQRRVRVQNRQTKPASH
ncbi:hypothetical protein A6764_16095 [Brevibacillus sp. WF146]|uniref:hypothetical protein n=1 Tax=Brevibacillus sp. WF146 TaxID=319501 RepID=UPI0011475F5F|nr:hypothetical protein [Brevibacillus sp. WF146]UYZ12327.1 hypothetical protein A6764_16095 [Brevibacillus sp. WF146]